VDSGEAALVDLLHRLHLRSRRLWQAAV